MAALSSDELKYFQLLHPREDAGGGGLSREYVLRIPSVSLRRLNWEVCRNQRIKRAAPCRCRTETLKNPAKFLWRWESDRRSNFFSPPAHLCHHIYDWNIVACGVNHPARIGPASAPLYVRLQTTVQTPIIRLRPSVQFHVLANL